MIVVQDIPKEKKRNLVEVLDGVKYVAVIRHVLKNMTYIYADNALERLQTLWDSKN